MPAEIGVVCNTAHDRVWLARLREWMTKDASSPRKLIKAPVTPLISPDDALSWRAGLPLERLVVTIGFPRGQIESCSRFGACAGEPIIVGNPDAAAVGEEGGSSSFIDSSPLINCADVRPAIRKSLIRMALRNRVEIRPPASDKELADYFALRYRIWKMIGFLRDENRRSQVEWEVDYFDRNAVPLCAITQDGKVIGCLRLIRSLGNEEQPYVSRIQALLEKTNDPQLKNLYRFPNAAQQPFDVLCEFPGFRAHFRKLIQSGIRPAEIGRVAVAPEHRGQFLSEALVDTAVSFAEKRHASRLFLACRVELGPLYGRCGFTAIPGLQSKKFFHIQVPSIVMERQI